MNSIPWKRNLNHFYHRISFGSMENTVYLRYHNISWVLFYNFPRLHCIYAHVYCLCLELWKHIFVVGHSALIASFTRCLLYFHLFVVGVELTYMLCYVYNFTFLILQSHSAHCPVVGLCVNSIYCKTLHLGLHSALICGYNNMSLGM